MEDDVEKSVPKAADVSGKHNAHRRGKEIEKPRRIEMLHIKTVAERIGNNSDNGDFHKTLKEKSYSGIVSVVKRKTHIKNQTRTEETAENVRGEKRIGH